MKELNVLDKAQFRPMTALANKEPAGSEDDVQKRSDTQQRALDQSSYIQEDTAAALEPTSRPSRLHPSQLHC